MSEPAASDEIEEGVCLCCKSAENLLGWTPPGLDHPLSVCAECKQDGTLQAWIEEQLTAIAVAEGWPSHLGPDGRRYYTPAAENSEDSPRA